jgi:hypothetical protein
MEHYKERARKVRSVEKVPTLLVKDEKLKEPTKVANAGNNFLEQLLKN